MNYQQAIDYLFHRLPMFSRIGAAAYKANLVNIQKLCEQLGNPQKKFKSIHIAGTNGKGSVSHMLAAILQVAGYKTGLYTSPHLRDFRERIRINGEMINKEFVASFTSNIEPIANTIEPSFFEITVAMAFDLFAKEKVDIAIIETGLGGRLDSTNIIEPELSIITNIGWDHTNILGNTLALIAAEKAGIIKQDVPAVIGEVIAETKPVFEKTAREHHANMTIASQKRNVVNWNWQNHHLVVEVAEESQTDHKHWELDLPGIYQSKNLLTVLEACSQLKLLGWKLDDAVIRKALKQVKKLTGLHGRWEIIHTNPLVILDVAHNADGIRQMVQQVEVTDHRELHIVFGMVKDKDVENIIALLPKHAYYYFTAAKIPRALDQEELAVKATIAGLRGESWSDVNDAIRAAMEKASADDMIVVCGSVFLVGEVQGEIRKV